MLSDLAEAVEAGRVSDIKRLAHTLKNSADNVGAGQARDACFALEQAGAAGNSALCRDLWPPARIAFLALCDVLVEFRENEEVAVSPEGVPAGAAPAPFRSHLEHGS